MSGLDVEHASDAVLETGAPRTRRRRLLIGVAVAAAALAVSGVLWIRWLYSAHALSDPSEGYAFLRSPTSQLGETWYSPATVIPEGSRSVTLDIDSIRPLVPVNTARATVRVVVCLRDNRINFVGGPQLSCRSVTPFRPGRITMDHDEPGTRMIYVAVTPARPGEIDVVGVHVDYRQGWRHGSQDIGNRLYLTVKAPGR